MFGIQILTDNSNILLSTNFSNYFLLPGLTRGTIGISTSYTIPYNSSAPPLVFFLFDVNDFAAAWNFRRSGTNWIFQVSGNIKDDVSKIKVYGRTPISTPTGDGLAIYNSDSTVNFVSTQNPLWLTDVIQGSGSVVTLRQPNFDQITGSINPGNPSPAFMSNSLFIGLGANVIGFKRTGTDTWSTYRCSGAGLSLTNVKYLGLAVSEFIA
jgi:hypothetical protein